MNDTQVLWIVAAIVVLDIIVTGAAFVWALRRSAALKQELERSTSAHERFLVSPQNAGYSGGPRRFGWVKGSGVLALTDRRVIFRRVFGGPLEIELADIASVSEAAWYRGMYKAGRRHVILHLKEGAKVAFMVRDASPWLEAFDKALPLFEAMGKTITHVGEQGAE